MDKDIKKITCVSDIHRLGGKMIQLKNSIYYVFKKPQKKVFIELLKDSYQIYQFDMNQNFSKYQNEEFSLTTTYLALLGKRILTPLTKIFTQYQKFKKIDIVD